jgi:Ca-activated chloride channel family protein
MKTSRIPRPTLERFGLFAFIESKRVILPLKGVECDFSVVSGIAEVSMTQVFRQENTKPLDCEYLFPLPADASVYFCEADINGRTIRAQVRERQEARQLAAEKKAAGFRTALVESERDNLFTLSLGNVQPGDLLVIQLKYFQTLRSLAGALSLEIPFCPGIRYIPGKPLLRSNKGKGVVDDTDQVPDASRITPVRIDAGHPDAAYVEVRGTLDGKFVKEKDVASPSHSVVVQRVGEELRITLSDKGDVPDRDFVLRWSEKNIETVASRVWVQEKGEKTYALLEIRAPEKASEQRPPADFYFLLDRSGSMASEKWNKAAEALQSCMKVLGAADRAMVTFFESHFQDFAERPLSASELLEDKQFQSVKKLGTAGGTELNPALKHVLELVAKHSADRARNLILITDAQIGNESAILELMRTAPDFPVHCFGIDVALNDSLLLALCRQQGGTFYSLNPNDDIEQAVTSLGRTLGQPVLLDLQLSEGWELADARIPNLYAGQIHYLSARSSHFQPLELAARTSSLENANLAFERQNSAHQAPYLHWCKSRIQRLVAERDDPAAIALSVESNLICRLTAFIAWDESEKVPIASHALVQPSLDTRVCFARAASAAGAYHLIGSARSAGLIEEYYAADMLEQLQDTDSPRELDLKRELSRLCHRIGIADWKALIKAIFDWIAEVSGDERSRRIEAVSELTRQMKLHFKDPSQIDKARTEVLNSLKSFVEKVAANRRSDQIRDRSQVRSK